MSSSILNEINSKDAPIKINNLETQNIEVLEGGGILDIKGKTQITETSTDSLKLNGGITITSTLDATDQFTGGSITTAGGLSVAKKSFFGAGLNLTGNTISNLGTPVNPTDAATKNYIDTNVLSLSLKDPVVAASEIAGTITTSFSAGQTIDGITLTTGDRILIKNQANAVENGIYIVQSSGAPLRSNDFADGSSQAGSYLIVIKGLTNFDSFFICTSDPPNDIVNTSSIEFSPVSGGGGDLSEYAFLPGVPGGQILVGGIDSGDNLILRSTSSTTKGRIIIDEVTDSSSTTTGSLTTSGGVGISKNLRVGGSIVGAGITGTSLTGTSLNLGTSGPITCGNITAGSSSISAGIITGTSLNGISLNLGTSGPVTCGNITAGTSSISAGIITGTSLTGTSLNLGTTGTVTCGDITAGTSSISGGSITGTSLTGTSLNLGTTGPITCGVITAGTSSITSGSIVSSGIISLTGPFQSTSTTTGALRVTGGIGVQGDVNIGGGLKVNGGNVKGLPGNFPVTFSSTWETYGDSITAGAGVASNQIWAYVVNSYVNKTLSNLGVSGYTSADVTTRMYNVRSNRSRTTAIFVGTNDLRKQSSLNNSLDRVLDNSSSCVESSILFACMQSASSLYYTNIRTNGTLSGTWANTPVYSLLGMRTNTAGSSFADNLFNRYICISVTSTNPANSISYYGERFDVSITNCVLDGDGTTGTFTLNDVYSGYEMDPGVVATWGQRSFIFDTGIDASSLHTVTVTLATPSGTDFFYLDWMASWGPVGNTIFNDVFVLGVPPWNYRIDRRGDSGAIYQDDNRRNSYNKRLRDICNTLKTSYGLPVHYVDTGSPTAGGLQSDGLHPSFFGQKFIGNRVISVIDTGEYL